MLENFFYRLICHSREITIIVLYCIVLYCIVLHSKRDNKKLSSHDIYFCRYFQFQQFIKIARLALLKCRKYLYHKGKTNVLLYDSHHRVLRVDEKRALMIFIFFLKICYWRKWRTRLGCKRRRHVSL